MDVTALIGLAYKTFELSQTGWAREKRALRNRLLTAVSEGIAAHHTFVSAWSSEAHAFHPAVDTTAPTVELRMTSIPRRLGGEGGVKDELDVLVAPHHTAILGQPGAGKTTTLRRLASHVASAPEQAAGDDNRFVIVVVCRDERFDERNLYATLASKIGITDRLAKDLDDVDTRLHQILNSGVLVLIDGLDEIPTKLRPDVEAEIRRLGRHLADGRIVLSCRSGDFMSIEGFDPFEILPLDRAQIRDVVEAVLADEADAFYDVLGQPEHPAAELANRPLFLLQMTQIFRSQGTIPERPTDLHDSLVRLVIQEWDGERRVRRQSKYASFSAPEKRRFLADLAYALIERHRLRFDGRVLAEVYRDLAPMYSLPASEARQVAKELEGHTGLIVEAGTQYEFSHLSLQEFLAADAMVRAGEGPKDSWWEYQPEVAAVAVALSSQPNSYFIELVDRLLEGGDLRVAHPFLDRIAQERPRFVASAELGERVLRLLSGRLSDTALASRLSTIKPLRMSAYEASLGYETRSRGNDTRFSLHEDGNPYPYKAFAVDREFFRSLLGPDLYREATGSAH